MNSKDLYNAIHAVDDEILERSEAVACEYKKKNGWMKWGAMAACLFLIVIGIRIWKQSTSSNNKGTGITISKDGVTIPQMDISLAANETADMIGFFIYQGRRYVHQYGRVCDNVDIIGEYLGTATGLINEWTPKEGYVELAGSVRGDFYTVDGYDPSFMLCMKDATDTVFIYICNTGITLKYGSELYEDRLHLSENLKSVQYESRASQYFSRGELYQMNHINDIVMNFIKELDSAEFIPCDFVPLDEGQTSIVDTELYHLYFQLENGLTIHLRLHKNGYVRFQGLTELCVQVSEETFYALQNLLDNYIDATAVEGTEHIGTTVEDCLNNAEFGKYVPTYTPEDIYFESAEIYKYWDSQTGDKIGTKEIWINYVSLEKPQYFYSITITWADEYGNNGWAGSMMDAVDLSVESISEYIKTDSFGNRLDVGVWYDNVSVVISAYGVDAETAFKILDSVSKSDAGIKKEVCTEPACA